MSPEIITSEELLLDRLGTYLKSSKKSRLSLGYLYLPGLTRIGPALSASADVHLLIGNTTTKKSLEQLAEFHQSHEPVLDAAESQAHPQRFLVRKMVEETAKSLGDSLEKMPQTQEAEVLLRSLAVMIREKRLKVRIFTRGRLHSKSYIFDHSKSFVRERALQDGEENGVSIIGSTNVALSEFSHPSEMNVLLHDNESHLRSTDQFENLWKGSKDFSEELLNELENSWALALMTPYDIYIKTLYTLVKDRLDGTEGRDILWEDEITAKLADFQKVAVRQAIQIIRDYGGVFVSDVVGMGKSFIAAAVLKHFQKLEQARPLIVCPRSLVDMWEEYNEAYNLNARVLSMGFLHDEENGTPNRLLSDPRFRDRDFVLVDESHNFRHHDTQRYKVLQAFLMTGRRCCFLTATPRNRTAWDIYHQLKLFHQDDLTDIPIDPPDLRLYFRLIEEGDRVLPDLLGSILIRRTRKHILRWYGFDSETHQPVDPSSFGEYTDGSKRAYVKIQGLPQFFPERSIRTVEYSIEDTYQGLYEQLRNYIGRPGRGQSTSLLSEEITYARYGLWHYVVAEKKSQEPYISLQRVGAHLSGLMRILLFKRFESSVFAFTQTVRKMIGIHKAFLTALSDGIVPAGEESQAILYEAQEGEEAQLVDALRLVADRYDTKDFDVERLEHHIAHDIDIFGKILELVQHISPAKDAKFQTLKKSLEDGFLKDGKRLIFTQYSDTARYLYENLILVLGTDTTEIVHSGTKNKARLVTRFSPNSNPGIQLRPDEPNLTTLIATDVLAEGLNLQDCDKVINYDLHWNPVRLIQRLGRIDRIGSKNDEIHAFNFLPETGIEQNLGLRDKLSNRIREIHETIGEDSAILEPTEQINESAMYAIYEKQDGQSDEFEEEDEFVNINEAEEIIRQIQKENPTEFDRIANLRDGIRAAMHEAALGTYVFCQAGRFQRLYLTDERGEVTTREVPNILGRLNCKRDLEGAPLPSQHSFRVQDILQQFSSEAKERETERGHSLSVTQGQRYVLKELKELFNKSTEEDVQAQLNVLVKVFQKPVSSAISRELNLLRRNGLQGRDLFRRMVDLYQLHDMANWMEKKLSDDEEELIARVICSESFV